MCNSALINTSSSYLDVNGVKIIGAVILSQSYSAAVVCVINGNTTIGNVNIGLAKLIMLGDYVGLIAGYVKISDESKWSINGVIISSGVGQTPSASN